MWIAGSQFLAQRLYSSLSPTRTAVMPLRHLRRKATSALSGDGGLLRALQSEIVHELSSPPRQPLPSQVGEFGVEWDDGRTRDVVLRRRDEEEEVAISGLLGRLRFDGEKPIGDVSMKVCVKKLGCEPVLRFDCKVFESGFRIKNAYYHHSVGDLGANKYNGPRFSSLDPQLQKSLKEYLVSRGIDIELTSFLFQHLHNKEHNQYVNWLHTLDGLFAKDAQ